MAEILELVDLDELRHQVREKYQALAAGHLDQSLQTEICDMVLDLENVAVKDLMDCLAHASPMR